MLEVKSKLVPVLNDLSDSIKQEQSLIITKRKKEIFKLINKHVKTIRDVLDEYELVEVSSSTYLRYYDEYKRLKIQEDNDNLAKELFARKNIIETYWLSS